MRCSSMALAMLMGIGCTAAEKESAEDSAFESGNNADSGDGDSDDGDTDDDSMPSNPAPFTLELTQENGMTHSLNFDVPSCQHFRGSTNFRAFWRDEARTHTYVLTMQVMSTFDGAGTYSSDDHRVDVKLMRESTIIDPNPTFFTDSTAGDTAEIVVDYIDEQVAWGSATISGLHTTEGIGVEMTPNTMSIWCPDMRI